MRTEQGRRKYNAMLEQRRAAARSRERWTAGSLAAVVLLVTLIGVGVQASRAKIAGNLVATNASVSNGVVFGKKAAATVDIYEDFQCPICLNFEKTAGAYLDKAARADKAQLRFHMISILDSSSNGNRYSSRAANAALCASDDSVDAFFAYHKVLYGTVGGKQVQPAENSNGRSNSELEGYAKQAGITGAKLTAFDTCVSDETHKALVQAITDRASQEGVSGTPTIKVNGKGVTASLAAVTKAIDAADAKGPKAVPSVTPKPTTPAASASGSGSGSATAPSGTTSKAAATTPTATGAASPTPSG
jgi:protein-disulfide isomerase